MEEIKLYSSSGRIFLEKEITKLPFIDKGRYGEVYRLDNEKAIKLLNEPESSFRYKFLRKIMNLNLPSYYHIYEILSNDGSLCRNYLGNISSYHEIEDIDIWSMSSDWLIENYEKLLESVSKLGEAKIGLYDIKPSNAIVNRTGITIIDVDLYLEMHHTCVDENIKNLQRYLLFCLLWENYNSHYEDIPKLQIVKILEELLCNESSEKHGLSKKLSRYPKPIDYIKDRFS